MDANWSFDTLFEALAAAGAHPAVITIGEPGTETVTYAELLDRAVRLAAGLRAEGLEPGEPAAIVAPNGTDWITVWLALALAGAVVAGLDDLGSEEETAAQLIDCGCRYVFAGPTHIAALRALAREHGLKIVALDGGDASDGVRPCRRLMVAAGEGSGSFAPETAAARVYTSGTTGVPKSFDLTRKNIAANVGALLALGIIGPQDRVLLPLPLHHAYPLVVGMLSPLAAGATIVLPGAVTGPNIVRALRLSQATVMMGVPRLYEAMVEGLLARAGARGWLIRGFTAVLMKFCIMLKYRFGVKAGRVLFAPLHRRLGGRLRIMVAGGAKLAPDVIRELEGLGFEVLTGYGLAETASLFTGNRPGEKRVGSEGRPMPGGEVRIIKPDEEGVGEIEVKGPSVFAGYRDNPDADAVAFTVDGWFRTGDLGRLDDDGYLYVVGRSKEMIVLGGGKNVFPEELEAHYGAAAAIKEIAVFEREGRLLCLVVPDIARLQAEAKTRYEDAVRVALATASQSLPSFQRLAGFAITREPLPRTRLGKYRRFMLGDLYDRALAGGKRRPAPPMGAEDKALLADPTAAKLWVLLEARYGERGLSLDANPQLDLGIDSLEWVGLSLALEGALGLGISAGAASRIMTVRDLINEAVAAATEAALAHPATDVESEAARWLKPRGVLLAVPGLALYGLNWALTRVLFRLRTEGRANLPKGKQSLVIAANHASDLDPGFVMAALPLATAWRTWWGGETTRLFENAMGRAFCRIAQIFPVDERAPAGAVNLARRVLARGGTLGWFPESWRTPTGEVQRFLPGIGLVLEGGDVPVLPVYIEGSFAVMPRDARIPHLYHVRIRFGPMVSAAQLEAEGEGESAAERIADGLRKRVLSLAPPEPPDDDASEPT
jgi:long-chain acyl-CoA synthetase